ncbi:hypothetical protein BGW80DRAFT_329636 [Lactifluus volemus]|nr:hypothetical protein BGW80DRAFT_329636 [Lactifluus volemus]
MNGILTEPNHPSPFISLVLKAHDANDIFISSRLTFCLLPRSFSIYFTPAPLFSCMPILHPPYPSFTLVMSSPPFAAHNNTRLPAYRASHPSRFHPYPRTHPSLHEEPHMATVDYRFSQPPVRPIGDVAPMPTIEDGKAENKSETSTIAAESILRRKKLKTAAGRLSAVIVTLRRIYRGTSVKQAEEKLKFELMN